MYVNTCYFNFNFNPSSPCMNVMWVWILFNLEYAWLNFNYPIEIYFISFGYTPIVIYFRILPCELIDSLLMGQVSGQAIAYVPYILSWGSHCVIIHRFNQTWDASNVCISFIFFFDGHSSNAWMPLRVINDWIQIQNLFLFIHSTV